MRPWELLVWAEEGNGCPVGVLTGALPGTGDALCALGEKGQHSSPQGVSENKPTWHQPLRARSRPCSFPM